MAVVDELSAAAELVKGKSDQVPVAVVRGYLAGPPTGDGPGAVTLVRNAAQDLFSLGAAEAKAAGLQAAAALTDAAAFADAEVDPDRVRRAVSTVEPPTATRITIEDGSAVVLDGTGSPLRLGATVHRVRCALAAEGLASTWLEAAPGDPPTRVRLAVGVPLADPRSDPTGR
jgi:coenzyme F420-0:L-glutamate ligase/coenzyme F420-1:gamma-L-glutamate ligase